MVSFKFPSHFLPMATILSSCSDVISKLYRCAVISLERFIVVFDSWYSRNCGRRTIATTLKLFDTIYPRGETAMMNVKRMANTLDEQSLPDDLVTEIFERLPVKSLMRFKCVSRYWCKQIKDPVFIKNHLFKQQHSDSKVLLLWKYLPKPQTGVFSFHDPKSKKIDEISSKLVVPFMEDNIYIRRHRRLLCQCNGIVCMFYWNKVALCNPALRQYKELPPCPVANPSTYDVCIVSGRGFGFTCMGDFKVVLLRRFKHAPTHKAGIQFSVYNLSTGSWGIIEFYTNAFPVSSYPSSQIFFNGICHWKIQSHNGINHHCSILSFNLSTEIVGELEYPDFVREKTGSKFYLYLMIINNCFGFVLLGPNNFVEIWEMKEYGVKESWNKQFVTRPYPDIRPLVLWKNEKWLAKRKFISCVRSVRKMTRFQVSEGRLQVLRYKESLISLDDIMKSVRMIKLH